MAASFRFSNSNYVNLGALDSKLNNKFENLLNYESSSLKASLLAALLSNSLYFFSIAYFSFYYYFKTFLSSSIHLASSFSFNS
jgi:hypothetical protein